MKYTKLVFFINLVILLSSCGKKEEPEFSEDRQPVKQNVEEKKDTSRTNQSPGTNDEKKTEENKLTHELIPEKTVSVLDAGDYVGKVVTVKGYVAEVHKSENVEYLNFVEKYPNNPFSGVIFKDKFDEFGDISNYANKDVELTGRVSTYKGKPQIILDSKSQIKVTK